MNTIDLFSQLDNIFESLVTNELLLLIKKYAEFNGEKTVFNTTIKSKDDFKTVTMIHDFDFDKNGDIIFLDTQIPVESLYNVSTIKNCSRCCDYDEIVLIYGNNSSSKINVFIYFVSETNKNFPTFEEVKNNFENKTYTSYQSLIDCNLNPKLGIFNRKTDRVLLFTALCSDIETLENEDLY